MSSMYLIVIMFTDNGRVEASLDNLRRLLSETNPSITCGDCKAALKVSIDQVAHGWENTEVNIMRDLP